LDDVYTALDDTLAEINMILGSRFVKPLREEAEKWKKHIIYMGDMVDEWVMCQKNWRYLSNIFKGPDIKTALPEESKLFESVDKYFKTLMKRTNVMSVLLKIAESKVYNTLEDLKKNNANLDHV
jgi:dynein heavy chain